MTIPAFILGSVIAALMGGATHLILGGGPGRLVLFTITGLVAFWFGHTLGNILGFTFLSIGAIRFGVAFPMTLVGLAGTAWLSDMDHGEE